MKLPVTRPALSLLTLACSGLILGNAHAQTPDDLQQLRQQTQELQSRIEELEAQRNNQANEAPSSDDASFESAVTEIVEAVRPVEIYGNLRLSVDYGESDVSRSMENAGRGLSSGDFGLSANTTVIGFRGAHDFELGGSPYALLYQVEQNFNPGVSEGDTFANRDTFGGFKTPYGRFRAGLLSTPFKLTGLQFTKLTTTVADPHAILGASSTAGGRLDLRGGNSIMWDHRIGGVKLRLQYGFDQNRGSYGSNNDTPIAGTEGVLDDNDNDMYSASVSWKKGGFDMGAAYVNYTSLYAGSRIEGYRAGAKYEFGKAEVGGIYENIKADDYTPLDREGYGAFATYDVLPRLSATLQWMHADETDLGNDGADQGSIILAYGLTRQIQLYTGFSKTFNDENARYRTADYAHGDVVNTVRGGNPSAATIGINTRF
ncbi:porin [Marinobacter sp. M1N3S26]|uniref:porin n=1 Tax=unclassified Marinobacter TaxID=83889 RepID=UPI00387B7507